jgi:hypothetical protein
MAFNQYEVMRHWQDKKKAKSGYFRTEKGLLYSYDRLIGYTDGFGNRYVWRANNPKDFSKWKPSEGRKRTAMANHLYYARSHPANAMLIEMPEGADTMGAIERFLQANELDQLTSQVLLGGRT